MVDSVQTTLICAPCSLSGYFMSRSHGKVTNLLFLMYQRMMFATTSILFKWRMKRSLQNITVNNSSIILDVQLKPPTAFLLRINSLWISFVAPCFFFFEFIISLLIESVF